MREHLNGDEADANMQEDSSADLGMSEPGSSLPTHLSLFTLLSQAQHPCPLRPHVWLQPLSNDVLLPFQDFDSKN